MNEVYIMRILNAIYQCCITIEITINEMKEDYYNTSFEDIDYFTELYDDLFNKTNEIEEQYGLIESKGE